MRVELSVKTTYLPSWGTKEGIRELIQNAKDAETEFKAPMKVWHNGHVLKIENVGATLPHEMLLFGYTTKEGRQDMIGRFGEGAKISALCLTRAGHRVVIRSGDEIWKPILARSEKFKAEVLAFDISKGKDCGGVVVEVDKIPLAEWAEMRSNFLFLRNDLDRVEVEDWGSLLLDPSMSGKVFVKGIFVQHDPKLMAGYDLLNAPTDRDRKVIPQYDLGWRLATIWAKAASIRPELVVRLYEMLTRDAPDTADLSSYSSGYLSDGAKKSLVAEFTRTFGDDAVPVSNIMESKDLDHFGKKGIVLPTTLARLLQTLMGMDGGIDGIKRKVGEEIVARHSWSDLSGMERGNLDRAIKLLEHSGCAVPKDILDVVSFRSEDRWGLWDGKSIMVAKSVLSDMSKTLISLIHELAHHLSERGDGEKGHVFLIEKIWGGIYTAMEGMCYGQAR
jgi:hypothetical protein